MPPATTPSPVRPAGAADIANPEGFEKFQKAEKAEKAEGRRTYKTTGLLFPKCHMTGAVLGDQVNM